MEVKEESKKVGLKLNIQKTKIMASGPISSVQFSSAAQSCLTLCDPMNCSTPGLPVHHHLPGFTQTHIYQVGDAIQPSHPVFLETCMRAKKQPLESCTEQLTGSLRLRKEYDKAVYCHPVYLISMQSTSWEMPSWMSYKLESRLPGEMSTTSDMRMIPL